MALHLEREHTATTHKSIQHYITACVQSSRYMSSEVYSFKEPKATSDIYRFTMVYEQASPHIYVSVYCWLSLATISYTADSFFLRFTLSRPSSLTICLMHMPTYHMTNSVTLYLSQRHNRKTQLVAIPLGLLCPQRLFTKRKK